MIRIIFRKEVILLILSSLVSAAIIHEFGHWLIAKIFGYSIKFRLEISYLWFIPILRGIWNMPDTTKTKQRIIALAGFTFEFLATFLFYFINNNLGITYLIVALIHLIAYKFYAGDKSDFNFI